jgi:biotin carboxyl carrier protein
LYRTSPDKERLQSQDLLPPYSRQEWLITLRDFDLADNARFRLSAESTRQMPEPEAGPRSMDLSGYLFRRGDRIVVHYGGHFYEFFLDLYIPYLKESEEQGLQSPMPGQVSHIHVSQGDEVAEGTPLVTVLAMKMENDIKAPYPGTVADIFVQVNDTVSTQTPLIRLEK